MHTQKKHCKSAVRRNGSHFICLVLVYEQVELCHWGHRNRDRCCVVCLCVPLSQTNKWSCFKKKQLMKNQIKKKKFSSSVAAFSLHLWENLFWRKILFLSQRNYWTEGINRCSDEAAQRQSECRTKTRWHFNTFWEWYREKEMSSISLKAKYTPCTTMLTFLPLIFLSFSSVSLNIMFKGHFSRVFLFFHLYSADVLVVMILTQLCNCLLNLANLK